MNIGDTVYVRWYGKVVEGKLLEGEYLGMKQVQIPLDGRKVVALFTPQHVYQDAADAIAVSPTVETPIQRVILSTEYPRSDFFQKEYLQAKESISDVMPADDREMLEKFKRDNWDTERGHLRIDKLDEFYQLWRMVMTPFGLRETGKKLLDIWSQEGHRFSIPTETIPDTVEIKEVAFFSTTPKKSNPTVIQLSLFD